MTKKEFLLTLENQSIEKDLVEKIEYQYGFGLPIVAQKIISASKTSIFFDDDWRTLSFQEIIDASNDLHVNFEDQKLIPLIDTGENDFIVYCAENNTWSKFNIVEECHFKSKKSFLEFF